jgi:AcrR family transcriptional regulator
MNADTSRDSSTSRGDQTREALLRAAIAVFGRDGFGAASTRAIASEAGANQALIGYHFGGKRGLYLAAFESIVEQVGEHIQPVIQTVEQRIAGLEPDSEDRIAIAVECMVTMFSSALDLFGSAASSPWVRLIMREQLDPEQGIEILYGGVFGDMLNLLTRLVVLARGGEESQQDVRLQAMMQLGEMLIFLTARGTLRQHMGWESLQAPQLAAIKQQIKVQLHRQFGLEPGR